MPYQTKNTSELTQCGRVGEMEIDYETQKFLDELAFFEEMYWEAEDRPLTKEEIEDIDRDNRATDACIAIYNAMACKEVTVQEVIEIPELVTESLTETIVAEPLETASTEMYPTTCSVEVAEAQMKPKRKTTKPKRSVVKRPVIHQTLTAGLGGTGANKITSTIKAMTIMDVTLKASGTPGQSRITPISFSLRRLYPMPESDDKFAEFRLSKIEISLLGFHHADPTEYPCTAVIIAPNPDERMAANVSEMLRHYGVRVCPMLACQNSVVRLITVMPRFDETGSNNHYVSGFLQLGEAQDIEWYGATVAVDGPSTSKTLQWEIKLLLTTTIIFRGRQ